LLLQWTGTAEVVMIDAGIGIRNKRIPNPSILLFAPFFGSERLVPMTPTQLYQIGLYNREVGLPIDLTKKRFVIG
jgi:hypothetical protein